MKKIIKSSCVLLVVVFLLASSINTCLAGEIILSHSAVLHAGEQVTVCGRVASVFFAASKVNEPTYINLDISYPDDPFFIIIWKQDRVKFSTEYINSLANKSICVTGPIGIANVSRKPFIVVTDPSQIRVEEQAISVKDVANFIGQYKIVKGLVSSAFFAASDKSQLTYLNIGNPYPNEKLLVVIDGEQRILFGQPEKTYLNKFVHLRGIIEMGPNGKPVMNIVYPNQIEVFDPATNSFGMIKPTTRIGCI